MPERLLTIEDVLPLLERRRQTRTGWTARCPAHEDRTPSLGVGIGRDGQLLLVCGAGCTFASILDALRQAAGMPSAAVTPQRARQAPRPPPPLAPPSPVDWVSLCADIQEGLFGTELGALHLQLGVSESALARLECGWSDGHRAYTFPMRDGVGTIVGVSLRGRNGGKWGITGSKLGFFIPYNLAGEGPLFMPEGASDTAALLDLGFDAVGRPQAMIRDKGRLQWLIDLLHTPLHQNRQVVVVADNDTGAGWAGAKQLARDLRRQCRSVKILAPPPLFKDIRDWSRTGVGAGLINALLLDRPVVRG